MIVEFGNKVLIIGYGSVSKCTLPILFKHIKIPYKNVTLMDFSDQCSAMKPWTDKGVTYIRRKITRSNMAREFAKYARPGGLIIDLGWNIGCTDILEWCHDNHVLYVNTSVEDWDPYKDIDKKTPLEKSLYYRQMEIRQLIAKWGKYSTTAILDHGANPGLISHFTKLGLADIAAKAIKDRTTPRRSVKALERYLQDGDFPRLAMELGVKVIHCSERDTQIANKPKEVDEFVGTWSIEGLREEGISPAEMGWGTHEDELPALAHVPHYGPKNQIFLAQMGMNTWVRSWIPHQEIVGMVIRHGEAFGISDRLTVWEGRKAVYRPTVHYAYMPCHETISSLHELRARNYDLQKRWRIMSDEITGGDDILGALLMGHKYSSWWTGSVLSIGESRRLVPHQNATTVQVAIGVVSAAMWMIQNPGRGVCLPDDLPYEFVMKIAKPYLGKLVSTPSDWTPMSNYQVFFRENKETKLDPKRLWRFQNFLFKP